MTSKTKIIVAVAFVGGLWVAASSAGAAPGDQPVAASPTLTDVDVARARKLVGRCQGCHDAGMLWQQRITLDQWRSEVKKMRGWGASMDDEEAELLARFLSTTATGPEQPHTISAEQAAASLSPQPDGPYAGGSVEDGRHLFVRKCSECHGQNARGLGPGVNLVDRPILHRARDFAVTVREGKGSGMPGTPALTERDVASLLAWLRAAGRNP